MDDKKTIQEFLKDIEFYEELENLKESDLKEKGFSSNAGKV